MKAIFPGSFNPIHNGHIKIIQYASSEYDEFFVLIANNEDKVYGQTLNARKKIVEKAIKELDIKNVKVIVQEPGTLTPNIAKDLGIKIIVRGSRKKTLSKYEDDLAERYLDVNDELSFNYIVLNSDVSSTTIRTSLKKNISIKDMVPDCIRKDIEILWKGVN